MVVDKLISEIQNIKPNNSQTNMDQQASNTQDKPQTGERLKTPFQVNANNEVTQHFSPNRQNVLVLQTSQSELKSFGELQSEKSAEKFREKLDFDNLPSSFEDDEN